MKQNKSFAAALIAAVGSFLLIPLSFYWFFVALEGVSSREPLIYIVFIALFAVNLAVFVMETIAACRLAKGKEVPKAYSIVAMVLNGLMVVLALMNLVVLSLDFGTFDLEVILMLCLYSLPYVFCGAANGVSLAFKLVDMLRK